MTIRTFGRFLRRHRKAMVIGGSFSLALFCFWSATAVPTAIFRVSTFAELDKGEPHGTFISSKGEVVVGRSSKRLKVSTAMMWSTVRDNTGTVYFGSGDEGALFETKGDVVRKVAQLNGVLITSLALGPTGKLLAAIIPEAKIIEIDIKTGQWRQLARLSAQYIWSLLYDAKAQRIYAASGSPGKIFMIPEPGGTPQIYYDPEEQHLLCLAQTSDGALLTGGADKAILYRITNKGVGTALHDFDATELRDVLVSPQGSIYVAVNKFERKGSGLPRFDRTEEGEEGTAIRTVTNDKTKHKTRAQEFRPGAKKGKGALYRLDSNGRADQLLDLDDGYFTDLKLDANGTLWAGDGTQGKVYLVRPDRTVMTAFDFPERQVLALAINGNGPSYIGTGDSGTIYRISAGPSKASEYLSQIFDAKFTARWGNVQYLASENMQLESRSGNTAKPDKTWNGWKPAKPQNKAVAVAQVVSPPGRYLQLRMRWPVATEGMLRSFNIYYLPQNQPPQLADITVEGSKEKPHSAKLKIRWKVENPDGDTLDYRLYYREEMGLTWRLISGLDPLDKTEFEWDTESIPDGYYRVKVVTSDEMDNSPEATLNDSQISERLLIDNRKPEIANLSVRQLWVSGIARDSYSSIKRIEYSIDSKAWRLISPQDDIYDSPTEAFRFHLPDDVAPGAHVLAIRALDEADNMGVNQIRFVK